MNQSVKMPTYEMTMVMRKLSHPALVSAVKRAAEEIYSSGGYIRKIESLGTRALPNKKRSKDLEHTEGTYMLMDIDVRTNDIPKIIDEYNRDKDIIQQFFKAKDKDEAQITCPNTLDDERKPPAERPSIQKLVKEGRKPHKFSKIFDSKTGLDYNPFHR